MSPSSCLSSVVCPSSVGLRLSWGRVRPRAFAVPVSVSGAPSALLSPVSVSGALPCVCCHLPPWGRVCSRAFVRRLRIARLRRRLPTSQVSKLRCPLRTSQIRRLSRRPDSHVSSPCRRRPASQLSSLLVVGSLTRIAGLISRALWPCFAPVPSPECWANFPLASFRPPRGCGAGPTRQAPR